MKASILAGLFCIFSTAMAQTVSDNLVPSPNHWTTNGQSVLQSYAINQALALSGSDVRINGFDYGYQYNLGSSWTQCTWVNNGVCVQTQTFNPRVDVNVSIRDSANAQIYGTTHIETGVNTGNVSRHYELRFADPRDMLTLGNFNYTASTSTNATVFGMYSRAVYTIVDPCVSNPQSSPACPGYRTYYNMWDDGYAQVNLPFSFPFYGNTFTTSYMFTNGVVGFLNTNLGGYCCDGVDLNQQRFGGNTAWNFAIYALNTDLYPAQQSRFYTQQTDNGTGIRYTWENVVEIGTNRENTFHVEIKDSGYIGLSYDKIDLSPWRNPLVGTAGNVSQSQYSQVYYGPANQMNLALGTNTYTFAGTEITDVCAANPLYHPQCPGYATAYHDRQCSINPLYATTCAGYQQAYHTQQCSISALYDAGCPGYQQAYYDQQCSLDALYDAGCPGYQQAYYDQQCSINPLYDSGCANYDIVLAATQPVPEDTTTVVAQADTTASSSSASEPTAATSATSPTSVSPAAVVSTVRPSAPAAAPAPSARAQSGENARQETRAAEQKSEQKKTDRAVARAVPKGAKGQAAQRAAEEKAEEAVADAANATTIEAQQAAQNLVLGLMGYNPAFSAYQNALVPDTNAAVMARQYNQPTVDNRRALRALSGASDRVHQDMVDQQYRRMP